LATWLDRGREYGMGMWKNARAGAAFTREYQQAAMETLEQNYRSYRRCMGDLPIPLWAFCRTVAGRSADSLVGGLPLLPRMQQTVSR
jgi:hypothetical protein